MSLTMRVEAATPTAMHSAPTPASEFRCHACHGTHARSAGQKNGYALWRCDDCGTIAVNPFPSLTELAEFYKSYVGTTDYTAKKKRKIQRSKKRIWRLRRMTKGRDFLDVGCNYGFAVVAASELGLNAHGIDIDSTAIAACKTNFADKGTFDYRTVQDHAASGATADIIYTSEVIEHVPDPDGFVAALAKILRPGGVLYLTTPDGGHFRVPKQFDQWEQVIPPEHLLYFTRRGLRAMLQRHGFTDIHFRFNMKPGIRVLARKGA